MNNNADSARHIKDWVKSSEQQRRHAQKVRSSKDRLRTILVCCERITAVLERCNQNPELLFADDTLCDAVLGNFMIIGGAAGIITPDRFNLCVTHDALAHIFADAQSGVAKAYAWFEDMTPKNAALLQAELRTNQKYADAVFAIARDTVPAMIEVIKSDLAACRGDCTE